MDDDRFTIGISAGLFRQLAAEDEDSKVKKRTKKVRVPREPKRAPPKVTQEEIPDNSEILTRAPPGWALPSPVFSPVPLTQPHSDLDAIKSVVEDSEKVLEKLQKKEESMLEEVTRKAKDLHDMEFKLPNPKPLVCVEEKEACLKCYKENLKNPLKCADLVNEFANCARKVRQQGGNN